MKLSKISLSGALMKSKANLLKHAKYYIAALAVIVLASIIVGCVLGLKIGFDYSGGTVVEVVYGVDADGTTYTKEQTVDYVENTLKDIGGLEISSCVTEETAFGDSVVFKLTSDKLTQEELSSLKTKIYDAFTNYNETDLIQSQYVHAYSVEGTGSSIITNASIALAVALVLVVLGVFIRYGLSSAVASLIVSLISIGILFSYVTVCRIAVDSTFIAAVITTFVLTIFANLIVLDRLRLNRKNKTYKDLNKVEHSNLAMRQTFSILALILIASLACEILITGLGIAPIRSFGLPVIFGSVIATLSSFYLIPYFYTLITFKRK